MALHQSDVSSFYRDSFPKKWLLFVIVTLNHLGTNNQGHYWGSMEFTKVTNMSEHVGTSAWTEWNRILSILVWFLYLYTGGPLVHIGRKKKYGSPITFFSAGLQVLLVGGTGNFVSHSVTMPFDMFDDWFLRGDLDVVVYIARIVSPTRQLLLEWPWYKYFFGMPARRPVLNFHKQGTSRACPKISLTRSFPPEGV